MSEQEVGSQEELLQRFYDLVDANAPAAEIEEAFNRFLHSINDAKLIDRVARKLRWIFQVPWLRTAEILRDDAKYLLWETLTNKVWINAHNPERARWRPVERGTVEHWLIQCCIRDNWGTVRTERRYKEHMEELPHDAKFVAKSRLLALPRDDDDVDDVPGPRRICLVIEAIIQASAILDDRERQVADQVLFKGAPHGEVARKLGISGPTVTRAKKAAIAKLLLSLRGDPAVSPELFNLLTKDPALFHTLFKIHESLE
jgi:DNA-directed RNA polymerase specialized sigma24 family protein